MSGSAGVETGTTTYVRFHFAETNSVIDAAGVVAWNDLSGRAGVRFTRLEAGSRDALRQWLKSDEQVQETEVTDANSQDSELTNSVARLQEVSELKALISSQQLDCAAALDLIVRRMMDLTRATGAAIVLREGEDAICRASAGNAPDVGVKLSSASLTGECFRTGAMVVLEDSEKDSRVNPEICRQLNFRSLVVMPVVSEEQTIGIVEVLSPNPRNFEGGDVFVLSFVAELIAGIAPPSSPADRRENAANLDLESFLHSPIAEDTAEDRGSSIAPLVVDEASTETTSEAAVVPEPLMVPESIPGFDDTVAASLRLASAVSLKRSASPLELPPIHVRARLADKIQSRRTGLIVAAVLGVILLIVAAVLFNSRTRNAPAPSTPQTKAVSQNADPSAPGPSFTSTLPQTRLEPRAVIPSPARSAAVHQSVTTEKVSAKSENADEIQIKQGTSIRPTSSLSDGDAPEAPVMGQIENQTISALPSTVIAPRMASAGDPAPVQSRGVVPGRLLRKVTPKYPEMARRAGVGGDVVLTGTIGTDGSLHNLKVTSGSPLLQSEAISAAKQWKYTPYLLDGKAIETDTRITISFHR